MGKIASALCALVLDGQECHALAAVRSLGRHGARVVVASHKPDAMGFRSRFCARRLLAPSPAVEPVAFADWLETTLRRDRYDALLFFGEATANVLVRHRSAIRALTGCLLPPEATFLAADRKDRVTRLASGIGIPVPRTYELADLDAAEALARTIQPPVIVKGVYGSGGHQVALVRRRDELVDTVRRVAALRPDPELPFPIVQEYIAGRGYGLSALLRDGEPIAAFMHRRLEEHDVGRGLGLAHAAAGAVSVVEPELRDAGLRLLGALGWDGVAMVEFRRSERDGRFYLMEVNPRFVGSLDLAVAAGVDLPWLYARLAAGLPVEPPSGYRVGLRYRWLLSKSVAPAFEDPLGFARAALSTLRPDVRSDVCLSDPGPHWSHLRAAGWWLREHLCGGHARGHAAPVGERPTERDLEQAVGPVEVG